MRYQGIERATKEMAYDNGCVNRDRSEESLLLDLASWLRDVELPDDHLALCDAWLAALTDTDMHLLCCGDDVEQAAVLRGVLHIDLLLTLIFEEVL